MQEGQEQSQSQPDQPQQQKPTDSPSKPNRALSIFTFIFTFGIGVLLVVQTGINVNLSRVLGHGLRASFISFAEGLIIVVPTFYQGPSLSQVRSSISENRGWYQWVGGALGAFYVSCNILVAPHLGLSLFFLSVVLGQLGASLLFDHFGAFGFPKQPIDANKVLGMLLLLASCAMAQDYDSAGNNSEHPALIVVYILLAIAAGAALPLQAVANKQLSRTLLTRARAVTVSFTVGTFCLAVAAAITIAISPLKLEMESDEGWVWVGGTIGVVFVVSAIVVAPIIGLAAFFVTIISGQLTTSLLIDHFALFHFAELRATPLRISAVILGFCGCVWVKFDVMTLIKGVFCPKSPADLPSPLPPIQLEAITVQATPTSVSHSESVSSAVPMGANQLPVSSASS